MNRIIREFTLIILFSGLIYGCNSENQIPQQMKMDLKLLSLTKDLNISADNPNILAGDFSGLAVDENGNIYAADTELQKIHIFSSNGRYLGSLGRRGKGPGEFTGLHSDSNIRILSDTLYVEDKSAKRINLFNLKTRQSAGTINIPNAKIGDIPMGSLRDMFPLLDGSILVSFVNPYLTTTPPQEGDTPHMMTVSLINKAGKFIEKELLQLPAPFPSEQGLVYRVTSENIVVGIHVFSNLFFYQDILMNTDPDGHLYVGKSDSLIIRKYYKDGELAGVLLRETYPPKPLTTAYMDSLYDSYGSNGRIFKKAISEAGIPNYWPVFHDFLFDDTGRPWVQLLHPEKPEQTWWVFDRDGKPKWEFKLPTEIKIHTVKNGEVYGLFQPHEDIPSIVRYQIDKLGER